MDVEGKELTFHRPLRKELINYAREDTHYLLYVYDRMRLDCLSRVSSENSQNVLILEIMDRSKQTCLKRYEKAGYGDDEYFINKAKKDMQTLKVTLPESKVCRAVLQFAFSLW